MPTSLKLWSFERFGVIPETVVPNILDMFLLEVIEELQKHDPDFFATVDTTVVERIVVRENDYIPVPDKLQNNLVLLVGVPGNRKLLANQDAIQENLSHMLRGMLAGLTDIDLVLVC